MFRIGNAHLRRGFREVVLGEGIGEDLVGGGERSGGLGVVADYSLVVEVLDFGGGEGAVVDADTS